MIKLDISMGDLHYPRLVGGTPFADEFNKRSSGYWVKTGSYRTAQDIAPNVL